MAMALGPILALAKRGSGGTLPRPFAMTRPPGRPPATATTCAGVEATRIDMEERSDADDPGRRCRRNPGQRDL